MKRDSTQLDHRERVMRAVVEIERDLDAASTLEALADHACLSPFHFHRVFTGLVGEGPAEYVRRLRLERAAHQLATTKESIGDIARRAGYAKPESFTRAFEARFEQRPSAFRAENAPLWAERPGKPEIRGARIEIVPPLRVAFIRNLGPYEEVPPRFEQLRQWARARPARVPANREPLFVGIAHDIPGVTPPEQLRFDCCMEVEEGCAGEGEIAVQTVFGSIYAVGLHQGTFATIADTYRRLARDFIPSQGAVLAKGPMAEIYLTPPDRSMTAPGLTEVLMPVKH